MDWINHDKSNIKQDKEKQLDNEDMYRIPWISHILVS